MGLIKLVSQVERINLEKKTCMEHLAVSDTVEAQEILVIPVVSAVLIIECDGQRLKVS